MRRSQAKKRSSKSRVLKIRSLAMSCEIVASRAFALQGNLNDATFSLVIGAREIPKLMEIEAQCHQNWCWAAVATSVARFLGHETPSQCELAFQELQAYGRVSKRSECCGRPCNGGPGGACDVLWSLLSVLGRLGALDGSERENPILLDDVLTALETRRPVCARVSWGHFVAIVGYAQREGEPTLLFVSDPLGKQAVIEAPGPTTQGLVYGGTSALTHFYFTQ